MSMVTLQFNLMDENWRHGDFEWQLKRGDLMMQLRARFVEKFGVIKNLSFYLSREGGELEFGEMEEVESVFKIGEDALGAAVYYNYDSDMRDFIFLTNLCK